MHRRFPQAVPARAALRQQGSGVVDAALADGGRRLVSVTEAGDLSVWDLAPDRRPLAELRRLAILTAGRRLDPRGDLGPLSPAEVRDLLEARPVGGGGRGS